MIERFASLLGIFVLLGIAFFFSTSRKRVPWRIVGVGIGSPGPIPSKIQAARASLLAAVR